MDPDHWSPAEKRIARRVFDAALERELAQVMAEFKRRAAAATLPQDMWAVEKYLAQAGRDIDTKYDYRYSVLEFVLALSVIGIAALLLPVLRTHGESMAVGYVARAHGGGSFPHGCRGGASSGACCS